MRDRDGVKGLRLADGRALAVDFVIDATGPDRLVVTSDGFNRWDDALPHRFLSIEPDAAAPSLVDTYRTVGNGWTARWPGTKATALANGGGITIVPGRLDAPLRGNVLALGKLPCSRGPWA
ncbi:tryptophan 7-halogenase [Sphingomonas sp. I4]